MSDSELPSQSSAPFSVIYKTPQPGEPIIPPKWRVPFDVADRPVEIPNAPEATHPAYAALGWHVTENAVRYCPAYKIASTFNAAAPGTQPTALDEWRATLGHDPIVVADRRNGMHYHLLSAVSNTEAVIEWFCREHGHDGSVLCRSRQDASWYVEATISDLIVALDENGTEIPPDEVVEGTPTHYLVDRHPNAIMLFGE